MTDYPLVPLERLYDAATCLKTLAHPVRLRMVEMLLRKEHTVGELAQACAVASHVASEHLGLLHDRKLLGSRREGRKVYYFVAEPALEGLVACIRARYGTLEPHGGRGRPAPEET